MGRPRLRHEQRGETLGTQGNGERVVFRFFGRREGDGATVGKRRGVRELFRVRGRRGETRQGGTDSIVGYSVELRRRIDA